MRLRPYEACVNDADFVQSSQLPKTQGEEFTGFRRGSEPVGRGLKPTLAVTTCVYSGFAWDSRGDIDRKTKAVGAEGIGRRGAINWGATLTAEDTGNWSAIEGNYGSMKSSRCGSLGYERTLWKTDGPIHI